MNGDPEPDLFEPDDRDPFEDRHQLEPDHDVRCPFCDSHYCPGRYGHPCREDHQP